MKQILTVFLSAIFWANALTQTSPAEDITTLLRAGKIAEAEELTNRYLVQDPANVDLIVMKGNVILNRYLYEQQVIASLQTRYDESIYNTALEELPPPPTVLPDSVARQIAKLWLAATRLDPARSDVQLGLCQVYSLAIMRAELLTQLPKAKATLGDDPDLPYHLLAYAQNLKMRGDSVGCFAVFRRVHGLFPQRAGLLSDLAGEFFFAGMPDSARLCLRQVMAASAVEETSLNSAFFLASLLGEEDLALEALHRLPGSEALFYEGLLKFSRGEKGWQKPLKKFLAAPIDSTDRAAASLLLTEGDALNFETYLKLLDMDLGDGFKLLLHKKYRATGQFLPHFNLAETYCFHRRYPVAIEAFQRIEAEGLAKEAEDLEAFQFYYAESLSRVGQAGAALHYWEPLLNSEDFYKQSAAAWFIGKYYFDRGDKTKGRDYFSQVAGRASESKFATMCWQLMGED